MTEKQKNYEKRWELFQKIWSKRSHKSQVSGKYLGTQLKSTFCDHLLERGKYPEVEYEEWNILLVTPDEHTRKERGFPGIETETDKIYKSHIKRAKARYEEEKNDKNPEKGS